VSDEPRLLAETSGAVITLTLDNPSRGNALTRPIYEQLNDAYRRIAEDPSIRVVVFTAAGDRHFCTGADVSALGGELRKPGEVFTLTWRHAGIRKPVVVAVNGTVAGGGLGFVTDGDIVVASRRAKLLDPHVRVGQICGYGALRLTSIVGPSEAARVALAGGVLDAERAHTLGLVNELLDTASDARARAQEIAATIVAGSPEAVRVTHELLQYIAIDSEQEVVLSGANQAWARHFSHPDATEGPRAFTERREPVWVMPHDTAS
jgi:E-phenylitaconyl-CoA hydratase